MKKNIITIGITTVGLSFGLSAQSLSDEVIRSQFIKAGNGRKYIL